MADPTAGLKRFHVGVTWKRFEPTEGGLVQGDSGGYSRRRVQLGKIRAVCRRPLPRTGVWLGGNCIVDPGVYATSVGSRFTDGVNGLLFRFFSLLCLRSCALIVAVSDL